MAKKAVKTLVKKPTQSKAKGLSKPAKKIIEKPPAKARKSKTGPAKTKTPPPAPAKAAVAAKPTSSKRSALVSTAPAFVDGHMISDAGALAAYLAEYNESTNFPIVLIPAHGEHAIQTLSTVHFIKASPFNGTKPPSLVDPKAKKAPGSRKSKTEPLKASDAVETAASIPPNLEELVQLHGGAYKPEIVGFMLGNISKDEIAARLKDGRLIAFHTRKNALRFPAIQFTDTGDVIKGLQEVSQALAPEHEAELFLFLVGGSGTKAGDRPIDLLKNGDVKAVVDLAKAAKTREISH